MSNDSQLIGAALGGVALILFLIIRTRLHAFVALLIGSLVVGVAAGMPFQGVIDSISTGVGSTLASIAVVIGLGAMFGRMLEVSGGAESLAGSLLAKSGENRAQWPLLAVGFVVAIPVFFDVAFVVLVSIVYGLAEKTGRPIVYFAVPLMAGLVVTHSFIPPTPGPLAVAGLLGADLGYVMLFGALVGIPAAVIAGPFWGSIVARQVRAGVPEYMRPEETREGRPLPSAGLIAVLIAIPLVLILANTIAGLALDEGSALRGIMTFVGHPIVALLVTTLLCFNLLGTRAGYSRDQVQDIAMRALEPAGIIILVTAAGGVLKQVLIDSGVGEVMSGMLGRLDLPGLLLAFLIASAVRIMQGSATVAMLTAAGLVSAMFADAAFSDAMLALYVIAIAAGATIASHVNDSGFWLVNRYLGLTVPETFRTWTAMTTIAAVVAILFVLLLGLVIG